MSERLTAARGSKGDFSHGASHHTDCAFRALPLVGNFWGVTKGFPETHEREGKEGLCSS
jgi:hypothetical protein